MRISPPLCLSVGDMYIFFTSLALLFRIFCSEDEDVTEEDQQEFPVRVSILGSDGVGKSSLILRYYHGGFCTDWDPAIGGIGGLCQKILREA